jgi:hypothetical protein
VYAAEDIATRVSRTQVLEEALIHITGEPPAQP